MTDYAPTIPARWTPDNFETIGFLSMFLFADDPRPAKEQINERYSFGGGWYPIPDCTLGSQRIMLNASLPVMLYPGDPPFIPRAWCKLRDEMVVLYNSAFVAIIQPDGSFEVSRLD